MLNVGITSQTAKWQGSIYLKKARLNNHMKVYWQKSVADAKHPSHLPPFVYFMQLNYEHLLNHTLAYFSL